MLSRTEKYLKIIQDRGQKKLPLERVYSNIVEDTLANTCELCGRCNVPVEIHHIRALKDIERRYQGKKNPPPEWAKFMMSRNRKTVVIGELCHTDIHRGKCDNRCSYDKLSETDEIE